MRVARKGAKSAKKYLTTNDHGLTRIVLGASALRRKV
jgi:hypothetical protein